MKRVLCLTLMVFMLVGTLVVGAWAQASSSDTSRGSLRTDRQVYFEGEPIMVTAYGNDSDWISITRTGEEANGSIRWYYIGTSYSSTAHDNGAGSGVAVDIRTKHPVGDQSAYHSIPAGNYTVFFAGGESNAEKGWSKYGSDSKSVAYITVVEGNVAPEKLEYYEGEDITVRFRNDGNMKLDYSETELNGSGKDGDGNYIDAPWFAIVPYKDGSVYSLRGALVWEWMQNVIPSGAAANTYYQSSLFSFANYFKVSSRKEVVGYYGVNYDQMWYEKYGAEEGVVTLNELAAGKYDLVYLPTAMGVHEYYQTAGSVTPITITVKDAVVVNKTVFAPGEAIMVTPYGSGTDWAGISIADGTIFTEGSVRWRYIASTAGKESDNSRGAGSGIAFDIAEDSVPNRNSGALGIGTYTIYVALNDGAVTKGAIVRCSMINIEITQVPPTSAPQSASYLLQDKTTGLAAGTVTVKLTEAQLSEVTHVNLYWGDANGKLAGYTNIGKRAVTGTTTTVTMPAYAIIPDGATRLLVYANNAGGDSTAFASAALPANRTSIGFGKSDGLVTSFQIVSDIHINASTPLHDQHFTNMLQKIKQLDPNTSGIFVAGDIADTGLTTELDKLYEMWTAAGGDLPIYLGIGNHDFKKGSTSGYGVYSEKVQAFINAANLYRTDADGDLSADKPYYDMWVDGVHIIMLGSEKASGPAYISDAQLAFLENKLAEHRNLNYHAPVFILLHQPVFNTFAGSLPDDNWNGVVAGDANKAIWEAAGGARPDGEYEEPLRAILRKYPEAMMFGGHSHWDMTSEFNMYEGNGDLPNFMFNTASIAYLWTDDYITGGEYLKGSQGYFVRVYNDHVELLGRDFANDKWLPNAIYYIPRADATNAPSMVTGASVRLISESNGLRFVTKVSAAVLANIERYAVPGSISYGTLVAPTDKIMGLSSFTLEALHAAGLVEGKDYVDKAADKGLGDDGEGGKIFRVALVNIKSENINRSFSAVGYVKYTDAEGNEVYCYASYSHEENSRSMRKVATDALADVSNVYDEKKYAYSLGNGKYSPYNEQQRQALQGYLA